MAIFKKEENSPPKEPITLVPRENKKEKAVTLRADEITTILGKGSHFEGKLNFEGTLQIEGVFNGEIRSESVLVIGEGAKVSAEIEVGSIIINGEVRGNVRAKNSVEIKKPGKLYGNIYTPSLTIEKGVIFEGSCKMENLDRAIPPPVEKVQQKSESEKK